MICSVWLTSNSQSVSFSSIITTLKLVNLYRYIVLSNKKAKKENDEMLE